MKKFFFVIFLLFKACFFQDCFGINTGSASVCGGNGDCIVENTCVCNRYFSGPKCSMNDDISSRKTWIYTWSLPTFSFEDNCDIWGSTDVQIYWSHPGFTTPTVLYDSRDDLSTSTGPYTGWIGPTNNYDDTGRFCMEENESVDNECMGCGDADCSGISTSGFPAASKVHLHEIDVDMSVNDCPNFEDLCGDANAKFALSCRFERVQDDVTSYHYCFGYPDDSTFVCSGNGDCTGEDNCDCDEGYERDSDCWYKRQCHSIDFDNLLNVCSGNGDCIAEDNCDCDEGYERDSDCGHKRQCNFTDFDDYQNVCSGNGDCVAENNCSCYEGYERDANCGYKRQCNFTDFDEYQTVCSGNGDCVSEDNCDCDEGYERDSDCGHKRQCNFTDFDDYQNVCSGNGVCIGEDNCECWFKYYGFDCQYCPSENFDSNCENCVTNWEGENCTTCPLGNPEENCLDCYGIPKGSGNECSGIGTCLTSGLCDCLTVFFGLTCNGTCSGILPNETHVCSGIGTCSVSGCDCPTVFFGPTCSGTCSGILPNETHVCNGRGDCTIQGCDCNSVFFGSFCEGNCFGILPNETHVCNGHGYCSIQGCQCDGGWTGFECETVEDTDNDNPGVNGNDFYMYLGIGIGSFVVFCFFAILCVFVICLGQLGYHKWRYKHNQTLDYELQTNMNENEIEASAAAGNDGFLPPPEMTKQKPEPKFNDCVEYFFIALAIVAIIVFGVIAIPFLLIVLLIYITCSCCCNAIEWDKMFT